MTIVRAAGKGPVTKEKTLSLINLLGGFNFHKSYKDIHQL